MTNSYPVIIEEVYPRPRGATDAEGGLFRLGRGLSPPARGNPSGAARCSPPARSIPARAGQPACRSPSAQAFSVYPRPRGATVGYVGGGDHEKGLSPPARGNQAETQAVRVYPRPRGATRCCCSCSRARWGLSPPARGNRGVAPSHRTAVGSIPARAGQPAGHRRGQGGGQVYPRPRGATILRSSSFFTMYGLSPPARGNLVRGGPSRVNAGSIPARAGQPSSASLW